ncbi:MAG: DinB family protein [Bryobacterales bacterium]|jgi:hypothetical protein|nr:DinB family protein [Bryobacterales bacterium]
MTVVLPGRPGPDEYPAYAAKYLARVEEDDILAALGQEERPCIEFTLAANPDLAKTWAYAPGKWTLNNVIGHICDTERILAYRALRIARGDSTALPGFDENAFAANSPYSTFSPQQLADELHTVRAASLSLLRGLRAEDWLRHGAASGQTVSVRALARFICGHERHHLAILEERYAPLLAAS